MWIRFDTLRSRLFIPLLLTVAICGSLLPTTAEAADTELPEVRVVNVRRAFHNGEHNAFTDLCRFQGQYYLTFRSCPDGHGVNPTSTILVLTSEDMQTWRQVHQFSVAKRDVRDPHFLLFQEKLFVYTGAWYCGDSAPKQYKMNEHLGYAAWTGDGKAWHSPIMLEGTYGHYIWRAASYGGKAYLCGRRLREFTHDSRKNRQLIESAILQSDDGSVLAVARSGPRPAQVCRSLPPYLEWRRTDLDRYIGGPLVAKWGERYLVGGRKMLDSKPPVTSLYWLSDDRLHECKRRSRSAAVLRAV